MEAEAVLSIIDYCEFSDWCCFKSDVLFDEICGISNPNKREKIFVLYNSAAAFISLTDEIINRAKELEKFNIKSYDALHAASAEIGGADILLTTDKRFINAAKRSNINIPVKNPLSWLVEVLYDRKH